VVVRELVPFHQKPPARTAMMPTVMNCSPTTVLNSNRAVAPPVISNQPMGSCRAVHLLKEVRALAASSPLEARDAASLPRALAVLDEIRSRLLGKRLVIFLDYDGTLTPIVSNPEEAFMSASMRATVDKLSAAKKVAIISGRGRERVKDFVQLPSLYYAGSHGHDISGPGGLRHRIAEDALPALASARESLRAQLASIPGAAVEDNEFSVSVHWRNTPVERRAEVENVTRREVERWHDLKYTQGKCVYEVRPELPGAPVWNKGEAVRYLLDHLLSDAAHTQQTDDGDEESDVVPIYIGDDLTDEDAFAVLHELGGLSFLVAGRGESERPRETYGTHVLADCAEVELLLSALGSI